jgi:hypothetical protein
MAELIDGAVQQAAQAARQAGAAPGALVVVVAVGVWAFGMWAGCTCA